MLTAWLSIFCRNVTAGVSSLEVDARVSAKRSEGLSVVAMDFFQTLSPIIVHEQPPVYLNNSQTEP